jgi:hypothetical protein
VKRKKRSTTLNDAPVAVLSDAAVAFNISHLFEKPENLGAFVQGLVDAGDELFIGVVVPRRIRQEVLADLDDALAEAVARLGAELHENGSSRP